VSIIRANGKIDIETVRSLLAYDPDVGVFTWRTTGKGRRPDLTAGRIEDNGYIRLTVKGKVFLAHRLAWFYVNGDWPERAIDHKNTIKTDNRIANLRLADRSQNAANSNTFSTNKSGFKGVSTLGDPRRTIKKYAANIYKDGRAIYLGGYATAEEAHAAYVKAANDIYGDFARAA